jgi:hypothetical protein
VRLGAQTTPFLSSGSASARARKRRALLGEIGMQACHWIVRGSVNCNFRSEGLTLVPGMLLISWSVQGGL